MKDEEYAALKKDVADRNVKLSALRDKKDGLGNEADVLKSQIIDMQKATDPLEIKLREETSRRAGTTSADKIGLGG